MDLKIKINSNKKDITEQRLGITQANGNANSRNVKNT